MAAVTLCTTNDVYRTSGLDDTAVSVADITEFILEAEDEIKQLTNRWWGGSTSVTEYFNRRKSLWNREPTKEVGYTYADTSDDVLNNDYVITSKKPVTALSRVLILYRDIPDLDQVWSDDGGVFTDNTEEANSVGGTAFNAFAAVPANGDILYIGAAAQWENLSFILVTAGVDGGATTLAYEYWNDAAWVDIPTVTDGTTLLTQDGTLRFEAPRDWTETAVNGSADLFYIRIRITNADYATAPTISEIYMQDPIEEELSPRGIQIYSELGKLAFINHDFSGGLRDLKTRYTYGYSTVPARVKDLCASLASLRALTTMIGGSYDDVTNYSIPKFSASKGEPYTNLRATITEIEKRLFGWRDTERGTFYPGLLSQVGIDTPFVASGIDYPEGEIEL